MIIRIHTHVRVVGNLDESKTVREATSEKDFSPEEGQPSTHIAPEARLSCAVRCLEHGRAPFVLPTQARFDARRGAFPDHQAVADAIPWRQIALELHHGLALLSLG